MATTPTPECRGILAPSAGSLIESVLIHKTHPLAVLHTNRTKVFEKSIPWVFEFEKRVDAAFKQKSYQRRVTSNEYSNKKLLDSLPFSCFKLPVNGDAPLLTDYVSVPVTLLVAAMHLLLQFKEYLERGGGGNEQEQMLDQMMRGQGGGGSGSRLTKEVLQMPLPIDLTLINLANSPNAIAQFGNKDSDFSGPLTLQALIGMLNGLAFVSREAHSLPCQTAYIYDAVHSPVMDMHIQELVTRPASSDTSGGGGSSQPQVIYEFGQLKLLDKYHVRVSSARLIQLLYADYEEAVTVLQVMGPAAVL
jgi:hypothetical protein